MSKTRFLVVSLAALIIIGLLILGGLAIHRIGWSEGYRMGQLAAGDKEGAVALYGFGHAGLFLTAGLLLLLLIVIGKFFRLWAWRMAGRRWMMARRPQDEHWATHWHRSHGPMPPWCWGWEDPSEERTGKAGPDAETGAAEA